MGILRLFNIFKNISQRISKIKDQTVYYLEDYCATGLANIVAYAKAYRKGVHPFSFNVDSSVAGSVSDSIFGNSSCTVFAKFTSVNYGWILCMSDNTQCPLAFAVVSGGTTYGWFSPAQSTKIQTFTALGKDWRFRKIGRVVYVDAAADVSSASAGSTSIGTLDADMRPTYTVNIPCGNMSNYMRFLIINPNGNVSVYTSTAISSATNFSFQGSYLANSLSNT